MDALIIGCDSFDFPQRLDKKSRVLFFTKKSIDKDTPNEDALAVIKISKSAYILAVADGAGGHPKGEEASHICMEEIHSAVKDAGVKTSYRFEILNAIETANSRLLKSGIGSKTTLTVMEYVDGFARSYQVGDSTSLICGRLGKIKFRSMSHSPVGYGVEAGMIDEGEALVHPDLNIISNLVGDTEMKIEIGPEVKVKRTETILLASDGLFDNFRTEDIVETIRKGTLAKVAKTLSTKIQSSVYENSEAKQDDLTYILMRP